MRIQLLTLASLILLSSCSGDSSSSTPELGNLNLEFNNLLDGNDLTLDTRTYTNDSDETYEVNELKYIISNIILTSATGESHTIPVENSYFVINEEGNTTASLTDIPTGNYTSISFGIGVDPTKYPIESGTLNFIPTAEEAGMLWTWSAGYKFIKFEGAYTTATDGEEPNTFLYHVGSHGATLDNYKEVELSISKEIATNTTTSQIINFDVAKIFDSINTLSLENKDDIQVDPENAPKIAENVSTAFSVQ